MERKQISPNSKESEDNYKRKKIISKGEEKKRFLQTFIGSRYLINIEEMDCPSLNRFK